MKQPICLRRSHEKQGGHGSALGVDIQIRRQVLEIKLDDLIIQLLRLFQALKIRSPQCDIAKVQHLRISSCRRHRSCSVSCQFASYWKDWIQGDGRIWDSLPSNRARDRSRGYATTGYSPMRQFVRVSLRLTYRFSPAYFLGDTASNLNGFPLWQCLKVARHSILKFLLRNVLIEYIFVWSSLSS